MAIGAATLLTFSVTRGTDERSLLSPELVTLAIIDDHRLIEPRLSLPIPYAPMAPGGASIAKRVPKRPLVHALAERDRNPAGMVRLLAGRWDEALSLLPRSGTPVDLAAAYYMRGMETRSIRDFGDALQALQGAADSPEVLFNRALILEQLSDRVAAASEWRRYLEKDAQSGWADEARRHREACLRPSNADSWRREKPLLLQAAGTGDGATVKSLVVRYPLGSRRLVELEMLPSWGASVSTESSKDETAASDRALEAARAIVAARPLPQERVLATAIEEIDQASPAQRRVLAGGWAAYGEAVAALDERRYEDALALFAWAGRVAATTRSSGLDAVVAPAGITASYLRADYDGAAERIAATRDRHAGRQGEFLTLFARLDWLEGVIAIARGRASKALFLYRRALAVYERLGEAEYRAAQHINQADSYSYLGDGDQAARHVRAALILATEAEDQGRLHGILKVAALTAIDASAPAAAVAYQDRLVRLVRAGSDRWRIADALVARSATLSRAGRTEEAVADLREVARLAPSITDGPTRERLLADADSAEAFTFRDRDLGRELASLSRAIDRYLALNFPLFQAQLYLERGRCYTRLGDSLAAERDFRSGVRELENQRGLVEEESLRISYFDEADRNFVELAEVLLSRGELEEAFDLLERSRSRELLDRRSGGPAQPASLAEIQSRLDERTVIVTHTVATDAVLTFVVSRNSLRAFRSGVSEVQMREWSGRIEDAFASVSPLPRDVLRQLGALLIDPLKLSDEMRLIFVPDRISNRLPSAAFLLADGRYLIEAHTISYSPSATMVAVADDGALSGAHAALIVASGERPEGYDDLPPLPSMEREAEHVARGYRRSRLIRGADLVSARALWSDVADYDVLHFAGHAVVDPGNPARSSLLVGRRGVISAAEIAAADLSHLSLVVLGGCNTGVGKGHRSEGAMSLARAFLAASVPAVVGTIAPIEDEAAERMFGEFHRRYALEGDAALALREAQLQMLRSGNPYDAEASRWSAYEVVGGRRRARGEV
ncbi:MAG: CHAT domain-containing protein [Acidobacteriota bacterium]